MDEQVQYYGCSRVWQKSNYCKTFDRRHALGSKIVDYSDVVRASPVDAAPTTIFILSFAPGFNVLHKNNCQTRWETFKFWDLVHVILEHWLYPTTRVQWPRSDLLIDIMICVYAGNPEVAGRNRKCNTDGTSLLKRWNYIYIALTHLFIYSS